MIKEININDIIAQIKSDIDKRFEEFKPVFENDRDYLLGSLEYLKDYYTLVYSEDLYPNTGTEEYHDYKPVIDFVEKYIEDVKKSLH
jgi:hypothetical protein